MPDYGKISLAWLCFGSRVFLMGATSALPLDDPRFGVMTHFAQGWDPAWIPLIAQGSITAVRDELYWDQVEPEPGRFVFPAAFDRYMAALKASGISPLIVLSFANKNYDGGDTPHTDAAIAAYARYAVAVLRHYGSQIKAVEIWNEYNGTFCTGPATRDRAGSYLRLLQAAYAAIKRERPDVIVAGGGTSGLPLPYWEKLLAGGGLAAMDVLSIHPYRYESAPEGLETDLAGLQHLVWKYHDGKTKPVWVTEIGWGTRGSAAPGDLAIDDDTQARFLVRAYALLLSADVGRIYWYLFRDYENFTMGLVRDDAARTPKPAYAALATMIRQLQDAHFVRREASPEDIYSLLFERPSGEEVRVVWSLQPVNVPVTGATGAVDLQGHRFAPAYPLRLTDSPLFLTGPLHGLPPPPPHREIVLSDSTRDFSSRQGDNGWSYGTFTGTSTTFTPLTTVSLTDWAEVWTGQYPYLSLTATDQHPTITGRTPVAAVRRWTSRTGGTVRIAGLFRCGTQGDGVGVSILVNGQRRFRKLLGGGNPIVTSFDFLQTVQPGSAIDFAVDPGPDANIDFDATTVTVTIRQEDRP